MNEYGVPKLTNLCAMSVVHNFERFMVEYHFGNNIPKRYFECLQKTQSATLLKHLSNKKPASKYLKFVLNKYIKDINLKNCVWNSVAVVRQLLSIANTIETLRLSEKRCFPDLGQLAFEMTKLTSLTLTHSNVTYRTLQNIGKYCISLETLNLSETYLTDDMIRALCFDGEPENTDPRVNSVLQNLDVRKTCLSVGAIQFVLEHFLNLSFLHYEDVVSALCRTYMSNRNTVCRKKFNLKNLVVSCKGITHKTLKMCRRTCPHITELSADHVTADEEINEIGKFKALTKVSITCRRLRRHPSQNVSPFFEARGKNLEVLIVKNSTLSAASLLKFCPKLKSLKLDNISFDCVNNLTTVSSQYLFHHLRVFTFEYMDFSKSECRISLNFLLAHAPNLEKLKFPSAFSFTSDFLNDISMHNCVENVQELVISSYSVMTASVAQMFLRIFPNLKIYNLGDTAINSEDFMILRKAWPCVKIISDYCSIPPCSIVDDEDTDNEASWRGGGEDLSDDDSWTDMISEYEVSDVDEMFLIDDEIWDEESFGLDNEAFLLDGESDSVLNNDGFVIDEH